MPPSTPCGNNLAENPPGLHVIVSHHSTPPQLSSATLIHKARRYLSDQDFSGCADLGPIRHLRLNRMPAEIRDLSPLCSTCGYKEANPCGHCTLSFQFFFFFLSFFKLAKDEVTMLQWVIHLEFMFSGSYFHLRAYLLVGCLYVRFMSHLARLCFSRFFFPSTSCLYVFSAAFTVFTV